MLKSKFLAGLSILAGMAVIASGVAVAEDVIAKRKELMKAVGGATKQSVQMVKGEIPFDATKARANMETIATWKDVATLFPEGTHIGDTTAAPKIWEAFDDFEARGKKMVADAAEAGTAAEKGLDAFKAAFSEVAKSCKGCHQNYRIRK